MGLLASLLGIQSGGATMYRYCGQRDGRILYTTCRVIREYDDHTLVRDASGRTWRVYARDPFYTEEFGGGEIFYPSEAEEV